MKILAFIVLMFTYRLLHFAAFGIPYAIQDVVHVFEKAGETFTNQDRA